MPSAVYHKLTEDVNPLPNGILVTDMEQGDKFVNGLILLDDNGKQSGIHPRWCKVYKVGNKIDFVKPGDWILVEHGRWSFGVKLALPGEWEEKYLQLVENKAILLVSEEKPF